MIHVAPLTMLPTKVSVFDNIFHVLKKPKIRLPSNHSPRTINCCRKILSVSKEHHSIKYYQIHSTNSLTSWRYKFLSILMRVRDSTQKIRRKKNNFFVSTWFNARVRILFSCDWLHASWLLTAMPPPARSHPTSIFHWTLCVGWVSDWNEKWLAITIDYCMCMSQPTAQKHLANGAFLMFLLSLVLCSLIFDIYLLFWLYVR